MLIRVKNKWLRRGILIVSIFPMIIISAVIGAVEGAYTWVKEIIEVFPRVWRGEKNVTII